jgi:hypothetical protein
MLEIEQKAIQLDVSPQNVECDYLARVDPGGEVI